MALNKTEIIAHLRELCGRKTQSQLSERETLVFLGDAVDELADLLEYAHRTDETSLELVAGQSEYPRPSDVNEIEWVQWNHTPLQFSSVAEWTNHGVNWRGAEAGIPQEFAVDGNLFLVYPPPSADAISTAPVIQYRYVAAGFPITEAGIPAMRDSDVRIAIYMAAQAYCLAHPEDPANQARAQNYAAIINRRLPNSQERALRPIRDFNPVIGAASTRGGMSR